jgi:hypothetical protein
VQNNRLDIARPLLVARADSSLADGKGETLIGLSQNRNPDMAKLPEQAALAKRPAASNYPRQDAEAARA